MTKYHPLAYIPTMFAGCMLFMTIYVLCVALWAVAPELAGHALLTSLFPGFALLDAPSFAYGLMMSAVYGWFVAVVFVFFYNLWAGIARIATGSAGSGKA